MKSLSESSISSPIEGHLYRSRPCRASLVAVVNGRAPRNDQSFSTCTDAEEVIRNLLNPGVLIRSIQAKSSPAGSVMFGGVFRVYFFDDLKEEPGRAAAIDSPFFEAAIRQAKRWLKPMKHSDAAREKLRLTAKVRARIAQFFEQELKTCAAELGGPAKSWPARYGFSVIIFLAQLVDDFDLFFWCDWIG